MSFLAALSTGLTLLQSIGNFLNEKEARKQILAQLDRAKFSEEEKQSLLRELDRSYNTAAINQMNSSALGLSSVLNADTYRGLMANKILGQRASDRLKLISEMEQYNKKIELEKANVGFPSLPDISSLPMNYVSTKALEGALNKLFNSQTDENNNQNQGNQSQSISPTVGSSTGNTGGITVNSNTVSTTSTVPQGDNTESVATNVLDLVQAINNLRGTPGRPATNFSIETSLTAALRKWGTKNASFFD